ncbi:MAG: sialidase family protein, partial [Candidatus Fimadaptatus sp.]|nr:sialidase family protein [Candidatus Fimadaptatus sp.]
CTRPGSEYGYFGWPSAAILGDGRVVVGCSGLRRHHVDPFGKTVLCVGTPKDGFGECIVGHDSPLDDRDAGVVALGGNSLLVTWFTLDTLIFRDDLMKYSPAEFEVMDAAMRAFPEGAKKYVGSWTMRSDDGGATFTSPARCPVSSPHGPVVMRDGRLIYLGKLFPEGMDRPFGIVSCAESRDGLHWDVLGEVPLPENVTNGQFHEPHVIELNDGALLCLIRYHYPNGGLGIYKSVSRDGGRTWSTPEDMDIHGSPPHLLRHSSGAIVLTYGWRHAPYGQRARISRDDGATWSDEIILRDDGPDGDLGYPCSVELPGGDILTVYYQKRPGESLCSILWTQWRI